MYIYTTDGEYPTCKVECDAPDVVAATVKFDETFIYLAGIAPGTVNITLSDDRSDSSVTFPVTVTEGEEEFVPHVDYLVSTDNISVYKGAEKQIRVKAIGVGMDTPESITVSIDKTTVAKATLAEKEENSDYFTINVKGVGNGSANITVANSISGDTMSIPVTSGNIYSSSLEKLATYIKENGEFYDSDEEDSDHYYFEKYSADGNTVALIMYYPSTDSVCARVATNAGILADLLLSKNGDVTYYIEMRQVNAYGICKINPKTYGNGKNDEIKFDQYSGSQVYKSALEQASPSLVMALIMVLDNWAAELVPGMNASDFGFIAVDYSAYGIDIAAL